MLDYDTRWEEARMMNEYAVVSDDELEAEAQIAAGLVDVVDDEDACPGCGERKVDWLAWIDDVRVQCATCGEMYFPPTYQEALP